ncbi:hypothetical protein GCM10009680_56770 [Streptomyces yatensis]|uniref:Uncharacterized protein n=1 Tax=Streptomyces yatensis TaxID=155177 RepID=A0ABN2INF8_9ACTN
MIPAAPSHDKASYGGRVRSFGAAGFRAYSLGVLDRQDTSLTHLGCVDACCLIFQAAIRISVLWDSSGLEKEIAHMWRVRLPERLAAALG